MKDGYYMYEGSGTILKLQRGNVVKMADDSDRRISDLKSEIYEIMLKEKE